MRASYRNRGSHGKLGLAAAGLLTLLSASVHAKQPAPAAPATPKPAAPAPAAPAAAGTAAQPKAAPATGTPPASPAPAAPKVDPTKQAVELFTKGMEAFQAEQYPQALEAFRGSYAAVKSPNSKLMVVRTLQRMGRLAEAYEVTKELTVEADEAAKTAPKYAPTAKAARDAEAALRPKLAFLSITFRGDPAEDAVLKVGGRPVARSHWKEPIATMPAKVVLVELTGFVSRKIRLRAGKSAKLILAHASLGPVPDADEVIKPPEDPVPLPPKADEDEGGGVMLPIGLGAAGLGVAGFAVFGAFGAISLGTVSDIEARCPNNVCSTQEDVDLGAEARTQELIANIGLGVGAAGIAAGGVLIGLHFGLGDGSDAAPEAAEEAAIRDPKVHITPQGFALSGRFH